MKKLFVFAVALLLAGAVCAQNDVTKFLGIPVDGSKSEMIQKLKEKGYRYNAVQDRLEGEFNGHDVYLYVVTNNNKVWLIFVADANSTDETNIKVRFNNLCYQFNNNARYGGLLTSQTISDDDDISYEITVHKKRYEAVYYQRSEVADDSGYKSIDFAKKVWFMIDATYGKYRILMYYNNEYNKANGEDL